MRNDGLDPHVHTTLSRLEGRTHRRLARRVHDIHVRAEQLGERAEVMDAVRFDDRWARGAVPLGPGLAGGEQRLLERIDRVRVLAMRRHDHPEVFRELHGGKQVLVGEIQGPLVREEHLERRHSGLHDLTELIADVLLEAHHRHVECVIDGRELFGLGLPQLERRHRLVRRAGTDHLDQRRCAASEGRLARRLVIVGSIRAHERQVDVHMRINEAWKDALAARIDDFGAGSDELRIDVRLDPGDRLVLGVDVAREVFRGRDDPAVANQERHLGIQRRRAAV